MTATVIRIGQFAGGSFGVAGSPNQVYDYFAVDCPEYQRASRTGAVGDISPFVYRDRKAAQQDADDRNGVGPKSMLVMYVGGGSRSGWKVVEPLAPTRVTDRKKLGSYQYRHDVVIWSEADAKRAGLI